LVPPGADLPARYIARRVFLKSLVLAERRLGGSTTGADPVPASVDGAVDPVDAGADEAERDAASAPRLVRVGGLAWHRSHLSTDASEMRWSEPSQKTVEAPLSVHLDDRIVDECAAARPPHPDVRD
jgi:hypothetical protein